MNIEAKKSLGQHFLKSQHVLDQIITASQIQQGENILEIGPGTGFLTGALLSAGANVIAIEKDDRAYDGLCALYSNTTDKTTSGKEKIKLVHGDILTADPHSLGLAENNYAIVANIPYYITGAILEKFLEYSPRPNRMVLLVQKEVAERIVARDSKESLLSISVKVFGTPHIVAKVPRGAFSPPPTVDSAILSINKISGQRFRENNIEIRRFFEVLRAGFAHKRKFLIRNLEAIIDRDKLISIWKSLNISEKIRAEDMRLEDWLEVIKTS